MNSVRVHHRVEGDCGACHGITADAREPDSLRWMKHSHVQTACEEWKLFSHIKTAQASHADYQTCWAQSMMGMPTKGECSKRLNAYHCSWNNSWVMCWDCYDSCMHRDMEEDTRFTRGVRLSIARETTSNTIVMLIDDWKNESLHDRKPYMAASPTTMYRIQEDPHSIRLVFLLYYTACMDVFELCNAPWQVCMVCMYVCIYVRM